MDNLIPVLIIAAGIAFVWFVGKAEEWQVKRRTRNNARRATQAADAATRFSTNWGREFDHVWPDKKED